MAIAHVLNCGNAAPHVPRRTSRRSRRTLTLTLNPNPNPKCGASRAAQDFEALTPNLLARTIETVEGGGIVVMLLSTLRSLRELFSLTMDVHSRLRTESHQQVTGVGADYAT